MYSSPNIFWVMESRRMRCAGHVARMGRGVVYTFWWGSLRERTTWKTQARWEDNVKMDLQEANTTHSHTHTNTTQHNTLIQTHTNTHTDSTHNINTTHIHTNTQHTHTHTHYTHTLHNTQTHTTHTDSTHKHTQHTQTQHTTHSHKHAQHTQTHTHYTHTRARARHSFMTPDGSCSSHISNNLKFLPHRKERCVVKITL